MSIRSFFMSIRLKDMGEYVDAEKYIQDGGDNCARRAGREGMLICPPKKQDFENLQTNAAGREKRYVDLPAEKAGF